MEQKNDFLGTESIGKLLWKMSVPAIAAQLINLLYNLVDRLYADHHDCDGICSVGEQRRCAACVNGDGKGGLR